ncbi:hypothetical protein O0I10_003107 [Lichtheimia ornata]|uniref:Uncharacterized protein n=1 Tax=Lichtheimia ornata TaxID=688661 RepID=A0AAD7Y0D8_9FUNG|nr:uncharacterized protein O0I10_003107 [Lichtheimia ornata]KAJ8661355.1 hypothetical protein O0I10_003107 [Lichtheimia ornata]
MAQRDHCRELLVFWCFGVYKITAMIAKYYESCQPWGNVYVFGGVNLYCVSGGWLPATGDFSGECQSMNVFYEWIVSATNNSMHIFGAISSFIPSSGSSRYRQFGGHPETKVPYRLITSAARNNLYIFGISKLSISWWFWLLAIPLMDLYNYTRLMDG